MKTAHLGDCRANCGDNDDVVFVLLEEGGFSCGHCGWMSGWWWSKTRWDFRRIINWLRYHGCRRRITCLPQVPGIPSCRGVAPNPIQVGATKFADPKEIVRVQEGQPQTFLSTSVSREIYQTDPETMWYKQNLRIVPENGPLQYKLQFQQPMGVGISGNT